MDEWTRLTPDDMPLHHAVIEYKHRPEVVEFPHIFRCDDNTMHFADAELLALTQVSGVYRQVPEVRALVEAATKCLRSIPYDPTLELPEYAALGNVLKPFQEAK